MSNLNKTNYLFLAIYSPSDFLCDCVLHLQSGVDFDEIEVSTFVNQELDSASIFIAHHFGQPHSVLRHLVTNLT